MQAASRVFRASVVVVAVVPGSVKHMFVLLHNDSSGLLRFYRHLCQCERLPLAHAQPARDLPYPTCSPQVGCVPSPLTLLSSRFCLRKPKRLQNPVEVKCRLNSSVTWVNLQLSFSRASLCAADRLLVGSRNHQWQ